MRQTCKAVDRERPATKLNQCKVLGQNETDWVNAFQLVLVVLIMLDVIVVHVVLVRLDMAIVHARWTHYARCARCANFANCGRTE